MNRLFYGDCLDVLKNSVDDESIDLIYIDPPFNSNRNYRVRMESIDKSDVKAQKEAFADTWSNVEYADQLLEIKEAHSDLFRFLDMLNDVSVSESAMSYLTTMALRIFYMHRKLKTTASFYLHCDPTMSHYLKIVCDLIFQRDNFLNEIIWHYEGPQGPSPVKFATKHDVILRYAKSIRDVRTKEMYFVEVIRDRRVNFMKDGAGRYFYTLPQGNYTDESLRELEEQGRIYRTKNGNIRVKYFVEKTEEGNFKRRKKIPDVWSDIHSLGLVAKSQETMGYPTQKPEALLERIIAASSNEGDVVADFFCGCGTAIAVAERMNRKWIGVDISHLAVRLIYNRLLEPHRGNDEKRREMIQRIEINGFPRDVATAKELAEEKKKGRVKFQDWVIEFLLDGVSNPKKVGDGGYDGYLTIHRDTKKRDVVLIEVKSGSVGIKNIREFIHVVEHEKATMGLFVCFGEYVTKGMLSEAHKSGYYDPEAYGIKYPRIQIVSIEDLLDGRTFAHPNPSMFNITFKKAR